MRSASKCMKIPVPVAMAGRGRGVLARPPCSPAFARCTTASGRNVVMMILHGIGTPNDGVAFMPSFDASYSDDEIAAVANYATSLIRRGIAAHAWAMTQNTPVMRGYYVWP